MSAVETVGNVLKGFAIGVQEHYMRDPVHAALSSLLAVGSAGMFTIAGLKTQNRLYKIMFYTSAIAIIGTAASRYITLGLRIEDLARWVRVAKELDDFKKKTDIQFNAMDKFQTFVCEYNYNSIAELTGRIAKCENDYDLISEFVERREGYHLFTCTSHFGRALPKVPDTIKNGIKLFLNTTYKRGLGVCSLLN